MWADIGKVLSGAVIVVAGGFALGLWDIDMDPERPTGQAARVPDETFLSGERSPREFLYLDNARTEAYLSQIQGGNETLQKISRSTTGKVGGEVSLGTVVKVTGEAGSQDAVERNVTPTASSNFQGLISRLRQVNLLFTVHDSRAAVLRAAAAAATPIPSGDETPDAAARAAAATATTATSTCPAHLLPSGPTVFAEHWCQVKEGDVVGFAAKLRQPSFVRLYLALLHAPKGSWLRRQGASLLRAIGEHPRLPLVAEARIRRAGQAPREASILRIVLPVQSALLTAEPSLLSPRVKVVGKVVRRLDDDPAYQDIAFYRRFVPALRLTPRKVRQHLNTSERQLREDLRRYRSLEHPAAVVLPLAIFQ